MDGYSAWEITQIVASGLLELLRIMTRWPVMMALVVVLIYRKFHVEVGALIQHGQWSAKVAGAEVASQGVPLAATTSTEDAADLLSPQVPEESEDPKDYEKLKAEFDGLLTFAKDNFCNYMNVLLVDKTKALLYWIRGNALTSQTGFEDTVKRIAPNQGEAANIRQVLLANGLIEMDGATVTLLYSGNLFLEWRDRVMPPVPPIEGFFPPTQHLWPSGVTPPNP